jgi:UDP-N-acetylmuramoyl-tripeptide--D-alanyl-D-alanine ligase
VRFSTAEIAEATAGRLVGPDVVLSGAAFDSRQDVLGRLFVPLRGERDGHRFVPEAMAAGAGAYLTSRGELAPGTRVEVADTGSALLDLGRLARSRLPERVVGVTGSVGKSSVKDMAAAILGRRWPTAASPRSFNNEIGVPMTLADAGEDTEAVVVEMGARGIGHIALLCDVAHPTVGVVTRVAAVHTALFGSIEEVALGKGELVESLPAEGTAVLNGGDSRVLAMATRTSARVLTFDGSLDHPPPGLDLVAEDITLDAGLRPAFGLCSPWGRVEVHLTVAGRHNVANALAAAGAAFALGMEPDEVAAGLAGARLSPWRMELSTARNGTVVLNDSYNSNPTSLAAALEALQSLGTGRRIAVLGVMAELEPHEAASEHRRLAQVAQESGIEVVAVDTPEYGVPPVEGVAGALEWLAQLDPSLGPGDAVLVKGSRVAGLERVAIRLLD